MTDQFYKNHTSSFFFGKRGKLAGDVFIKDKLVFRKDELVTIIGKATYFKIYGLKSGLEIESLLGNNEIISHNMINLYENYDNLFISQTEYNQRQTEILNEFLSQKDVSDITQLNELIFKYSILIKNLERYILVTDN
jgi:hypothetical protein